MKSVFIDTNVWLDFLMEKRERHETTKTVFVDIFDKVEKIGTSEDILTTVYYVASKSVEKSKILDFFSFLEDETTIHCFGSKTRKRAAEISNEYMIKNIYFDFEDLMQYLCAEDGGYTYFLTNDKNLSKMSNCEIVDIFEFGKLLNEK